MRFNQQIKKGARSALRGNWGKTTSIFMVFVGLWLLLSTTETLLYLMFGFDPYTDPYMTSSYYLDDILAFSWQQMLITGILSLLWLMIFIPMLCGGVRWIHGLSGGEAPELKTLFSCFTSLRRYIRSISAAFHVLIRSAVWLAAFIALPLAIAVFFQTFPFTKATPLARFAGFGVTAGWILMTIAIFFFLIFVQRYSLVCYYLAENEKLTARKVVKQSVRTMDGHCGELFSLRLSFFWWFLLSVLILPLLYVVPYYQASIAIYARYLMEYRSRADQEPPAPPSEWMEEPAAPAGELPAAADDKTQEYPVSEVRQHLEP